MGKKLDLGEFYTTGWPGQKQAEGILGAGIGLARVASIFDWITPLFNLGRSVVETATGGESYALSMRGNVIHAHNVLKDAGIGSWYKFNWPFPDVVMISYDDLPAAQRALNAAGIEWSE